MSLRSPNLDDRRFTDLMKEAVAQAERSSGWKPNNPGDPGTVLLELFAHLTECMLYRVNRLPEKIYVELLRLIGVELQPPSAAMTRLTFSLKDARPTAVTIAENTRVGAGDKGPEFMTLADATIPAGETSVEVLAIHAKWLDFKAVGTGTGLPGLVLQLVDAPLIARAPGRTDLIVGVELSPEESVADGDHYRHSDGKTYRVWREVESFAGADAHACIYTIDRTDGILRFAPALAQGDGVDGEYRAVAAIPGANKNIIARYRVGGGVAGNLAPGSVTKLLDKIPGVGLTVSNNSRATGGCDTESLANALVRGPLELHSLQRAVTAQDFELIASKQSGLVNRAHAYTKRALWQYAAPGTVEVILVPQVFGEQGPLTPQVMVENQNDDVLKQIQQTLDMRKPLGTTCSVTWCRYKSVKAKVSLTVHREENRDAVRTRINDRLYQMIKPIADDIQHTGWPFGQALGAYDIYRILTSEPGVKSVDPVVLEVSNVPSARVSYIDADPWQAHTLYAAADNALYRTLNNGFGWEQINCWPDERVRMVKSFPRENQITASVAGLVAVLTHIENTGTTDNALYLSYDCGETWQRVRKPDFIVNDFAWIERNGRASLLIATEKGLFEQSAFAHKEWKPITLDPNNQSLPVRSISVATNQAGLNTIIAATPPDSGVYLAVGHAQEFKPIGLKGKIVEVLKIQYLDTQRYLWAGLAAVGSDPGQGCFRWQLQDSGESAEGWKAFNSGWAAGACTAIDFAGREVFAASRRLGVLSLKMDQDQPQWQAANVNGGLPMEQLGEFEAVTCLALTSAPESKRSLFAVGPKGIYRQTLGEAKFDHCSQAEFNDKVTLPATWLFCSDEHQVTVNYD